MVPENIHTTPTEGIGFSTGERGGGGEFAQFSSGEGRVHHKEIFLEGSRDT